jgi:GST-like protein
MVVDIAPGVGLVPPAGAAERNAFLRWLAFLIAAIYPTHTYGDSPAKWLPDSADANALRIATDRHREALWRMVEANTDPRPWFLGTRFSALDIYIGAMTHWRPRQEWFARECPKLLALAREAESLPALSPLYRAQFG